MENDKIKNQINQNAINNQFTVSPISAHTHNGADSLLISTVDLPPGTPIKLGLGAIISVQNNVASGSAGEQIQTSIGSGKDQTGTIGITGGNLQLNLLHQPQNASNQSFINAYRPPVYGNISGTTISTTMGGNTVTTVGYGFTVNSLAGALINIFNAAGALVETQTIASNTATIITITNTWRASTSGGSLAIFVPVFYGSADIPYQRFYTQEGDGTGGTSPGGIRFGVGPTNTGQNGLLYMDATGDLYWRDKAGISTKLN